MEVDTESLADARGASTRVSAAAPLGLSKDHISPRSMKKGVDPVEQDRCKAQEAFVQDALGKGKKKAFTRIERRAGSIGDSPFASA